MCSFSSNKMSNVYNTLIVKGQNIVGRGINVTCKVHQLLENNRVKVVACYECYIIV